MRTHYCGDVNERLVGSTIDVAGWVHRRRDHGGVIFIDLRDRDGLLQVVFDPDAAAVFAEADEDQGGRDRDRRALGALEGVAGDDRAHGRGVAKGGQLGARPAVGDIAPRTADNHEFGSVRRR